MEYSQCDMRTTSEAGSGVETHSDPLVNRDITSDTHPVRCTVGAEVQVTAAQSQRVWKRDTLPVTCSVQTAPALGPCCSNHASLWCLCFCSSGHLLTGNTVHPASCSQLSAQSHNSPSVQQKYCVYTFVIGPKRTLKKIILSSLLSHPPSLASRMSCFHRSIHCVFDSVCHLSLISALMKCGLEERSAPPQDYCSLCLANKLKQDIALRSGPSMNFTYKQNQSSIHAQIIAHCQPTFSCSWMLDACLLIYCQS